MNQQNPASLNETLNRLIARYLEKEKAGETINRAEVLDWHPELADNLRSYFANHDRMRATNEPKEDMDAPTLPPINDHRMRRQYRQKRPAEDATLPPQETPIVDKNRSGEKVRYFGDYELLEEVARGGMGVVYRARQTKLNRLVALKMILAGQLASDEDVERFHAEVSRTPWFFSAPTGATITPTASPSGWWAAESLTAPRMNLP